MGCFLLSYLPNCWFNSLIHLLCCWYPVSYSAFQLLYSSFLTGPFYVFYFHFYIFISLLKFSLSSPTRPLSSLSILITSDLTLHLLDCLSRFYLVLYMELCSVPSFVIYFFVFSFLLPPCVCFFVLGISAMCISHGGVALCSRCPVESSGAASPVTWAGCSRRPPTLLRAVCSLLL